MTNVTIDRQVLLARIKANREKHHDLFLKAWDGFKARVVEELDRMKQEALTPGGKVRTHVALQAPEDHTADYDVVIEMLEMSSADDVAISQVEFRSYVRDEWSWSKFAFWKNTSYASGGYVGENAQLVEGGEMVVPLPR